MTDAEGSRLAYERNLWNAGYRCIAGVDEVGRGALAGPLVAAAVILPPEARGPLQESAFWNSVEDSKKVSREQRAWLSRKIFEEALAVGIGVVPVSDLDAAALEALLGEE